MYGLEPDPSLLCLNVCSSSVNCQVPPWQQLDWGVREGLTPGPPQDSLIQCSEATCHQQGPSVQSSVVLIWGLSDISSVPFPNMKIINQLTNNS